MPTSHNREQNESDRPYHHGSLQETLLDTAEALLEQAGVEGVALRELARAAGVSHNAPYRHFPSREALLVALATRGFKRLADALEPLEAALPGAGRLLAIGQRYLTFAAAGPRLYQLMFGAHLVRADHPALQAAAIRAFNVLHRPGPGMPGESRAAAVGAWALVHGLAQLMVDRQLNREEALSDALLAEVMGLYARGLEADQGRQAR